ncbi:MAG: class I SAM-dependent methyltransferase [Alphaproteobacteria bacterium]|nr:class I SAM-dependent methyltransferase [Alphaproteobacteria bacterium]
MSDPKQNEGSFDLWSRSFAEYQASGLNAGWPSENLVRIFKGIYIPGFPKEYKGLKVLDVGCGNGNNLIFLGTLGFRLYGTEVRAPILDLIKDNTRRFGFEVDVKVGFNRELPWPDATFDYLVSWDVIHYETDEADLRKGLREYARVLKPGGRLMLQTCGPDNWVLDGCSPLGNHRYRITRDDDFRKGEVFCIVESRRYAELYFGEVFNEVRVGRVTDDLFGLVNDHFLVTGLKRG